MDVAWKRIVVDLESTERRLQPVVSEAARVYVGQLRKYAEANAASAALLAGRLKVPRISGHRQPG
jgi:hypothetical protein